MAKFLTLAQLQKEFGITMRSLRELMQREIYEPVKSIADQAKAIAAGVRRDADEGKFKGDPGEPGAKGDPGTDGHTPERGVDYWTAADQQSIVDEVLSELPVWGGGSY